MARSEFDIQVNYKGLDMRPIGDDEVVDKSDVTRMTYGGDTIYWTYKHIVVSTKKTSANGGNLAKDNGTMRKSFTRMWNKAFNEKFTFNEKTGRWCKNPKKTLSFSERLRKSTMAW